MDNTLQFQSGKSPSTGPKTAIILWYVVCIAGAVWLTAQASESGDRPGNDVRRTALLACAAVYVARAAHTLFSFVQRTVPWWEAIWGGSIIGCVLFVFLRVGLQDPHALGTIDLLAAVIYMSGSYLGTASEHSRQAWKARPENRGHLFTEGLFRFSRHINYFGDLLLFLAFGMLTRQLWTCVVPLAMGLNFAFMIIPAHDRYLAQHYGREFELFAGRTKKLIPLVY